MDGESAWSQVATVDSWASRIISFHNLSFTPAKPKTNSSACLLTSRKTNMHLSLIWCVITTQWVPPLLVLLLQKPMFLAPKPLRYLALSWWDWGLLFQLDWPNTSCRVHPSRTPSSGQIPPMVYTEYATKVLFLKGSQSTESLKSKNCWTRTVALYSGKYQPCWLTYERTLYHRISRKQVVDYRDWNFESRWVNLARQIAHKVLWRAWEVQREKGDANTLDWK